MESNSWDVTDITQSAISIYDSTIKGMVSVGQITICMCVSLRVCVCAYSWTSIMVCKFVQAWINMLM